MKTFFDLSFAAAQLLEAAKSRGLPLIVGNHSLCGEHCCLTVQWLDLELPSIIHNLRLSTGEDDKLVVDVWIYSDGKENSGLYKRAVPIENLLTNLADFMLKPRQKIEDDWVFGMTGQVKKMLEPFGLSGRVDMAYSINGIFQCSLDPRGIENALHLVDVHPCGRIVGQFFSNLDTGEERFRIDAPTEGAFISALCEKEAA